MSGQAMSNVAFVVLLLTLGVLYLLLVVPPSGRSAPEALKDAPVPVPVAVHYSDTGFAREPWTPTPVELAQIRAGIAAAIAC